MLISELVKYLEEILSCEGDLDVRLQCDHGQVVMDTTNVTTSWIVNEYMAEPIDEEDLDDTTGPLIKVCELQAF